MTLPCILYPLISSFSFPLIWLSLVHLLQLFTCCVYMMQSSTATPFACRVCLYWCGLYKSGYVRIHTLVKNSQQDLDKNLAWISARSCMISQEFGTPCYILLHLDKILSRFLWDFASCKISQDFGTYPTKSCNILLRSCGVFLQG